MPPRRGKSRGDKPDPRASFLDKEDKGFINKVKKRSLSDVTKEEYLAALYKNGGLVSHTANALGFRPRDRWIVYELAKKFDLKDEIKNSREVTLDIAESKLIEKIHEGDLGAICFYLKTIGKSRGYVERQEIGTPDNSPIISVEVGPNPYLLQENKKLIEACKPDDVIETQAKTEKE